MLDFEKDFYDELPVEVLLKAYFEIRQNIEKQLLSEAMYFELDAIKKAVRAKGITIID